MAGLVGPLLETVNRVTSVAVVAPGRTLTKMRFAPEKSPCIHRHGSQDVTERLLVEQPGCKGGAVQYETSFVPSVRHDDYVSVTLAA